MVFEDLFKDITLIDALSKEELETLKDEGNEKIKPYQNVINEIYNRISKIEKKEYLDSRGIKNYPILNDLVEMIGEEYLDIIIDIDEILEYVGTLGTKYFTTSYILNFAEKYEISITSETCTKITDFLESKNIIIKMYELVCTNCEECLATFKGIPSDEEFFANIRELNEEIDDDIFVCGECNAEITIESKNNIQPSMFFYKCE